MSTFFGETFVATFRRDERTESETSFAFKNFGYRFMIRLSMPTYDSNLLNKTIYSTNIDENIDKKIERRKPLTSILSSNIEYRQNQAMTISGLFMLQLIVSWQV